MFRKALALAAGAVALILGLMFSLVLIAVVVMLGLVAWGYLWWKRRQLRRAVGQRPAAGGQVIDGEAVVVEEGPGSGRPVLPRLPSADN